MEEKEESGEKKSALKKTLTIILNTVLTVVIVILASILILTFIFQPCEISGTSMVPTLSDAQVVMLRKGHNCSLNDIVVIQGQSDEGNIIKRVIAEGGDRIVFRTDPQDHSCVQLFRDTGFGFEQVDETAYIKEPMKRTFFEYQQGGKFYDGEYRLAPYDTSQDDFDKYAIVVPEGEIFFLGDNRNDSRDSRFYGTCPKTDVVGVRAEKFENTIIQYVLILLSRKKI